MTMKKIVYFILTIFPGIAISQSIPQGVDSIHYSMPKYTWTKAQTDSVMLLRNSSLTSGLIYTSLSKNSNYTVKSSDFNTAFLKILDLYVDATAGNITIAMPSVIAGYTVYVTKTDASANTVTVSNVLGDNILYSRYQVRCFLNNSTNWYNH